MGADLPKRLAPDELWEPVAPLLPSFAARPQGGGTAPRDERAAFTAVTYVLIESGEHLGRHRWKIERSIARLFGYHRLGIRYERKGSHFLGLAAALPCPATGSSWNLPRETTSQAMTKAGRRSFSHTSRGR
ncbi:hypothetical protein ACQKM2_02105 [Streptomyces sp. NPDC004126]|uniref:hypothetical protein n=1 Tax=Streptomyces sp. NPDC004126 TaxID=3390695 RepID=UPI003CFE8BEE